MVNFDKLNDMCNWEREKTLFLIKVATDLGMDISGFGEIGVNPNSGYTYLWLEDYLFTLYMPINCSLKRSDVYALWTNPENSEEVETILDERSLEDLEEWTKELNKELIRENNER